MEFKKKTIIWEDNNEPPKDYIWIKSDGKAYEYSYSQRKWIESKSISGSGNSEPVEANPTIEDDDVTIPLNALKIGESVYTVGGDSDSDIQIVELTYDHLPATGTLSASDLAKLDSDNCLLVMNGKYFRKTFSSDGGIDYKEIGLTTVLGGVRSIYFTASKPDGEYTIAYTYPVEANTQTQANATLENIKVGNTTYSVPLAPIIVNGEINDNNLMFLPNPGSVSITDAYQHFASGGTVIIGVGDGKYSIISAERKDLAYILMFLYNSDMYQWVEVIPIYVHGTVYHSDDFPENSFIADDITDSGYGSYNSMYNAVREAALDHNTLPLYISYENEHGETVTDHVVGYSSDYHLVYTEGNIFWTPSGVYE